MSRIRQIALPAILLLLSLSCVKESPTVNPADIITGGGGALPGYYYPAVQDVFPADASAGNPVNTKYVIVFNIPITTASLSANITISSSSLGALTEGVHYSIGFGAAPVTVVTLTFIGGMSPIPNGDTVTVNIGAGIIDSANGVSLNNPGARTFSVGSSADSTAPAITGGTNTPTGGGISLTAPGIAIQFTETGEIDASTLNSDTFYVETGGVKVPATIAYTALTNTATLTVTETLETSTTYTVHVTTGIEDLSGNALAAGTTWTFDTTNVEIDPFPGAPTLTSGLNVDAVTGTTADLSWITSEASNYTLNYGRNNDGTGLGPVSDLVTFTSMHSLNLAALTAGKRYYAKVDFTDVAGNNGVTSAVVEFNTITGDAPSTLDGGAANQHTLNSISNRWGVANSGAFVFWTDETSTFRYIYGQRFNSAAAEQWAAGGLPLANTAATNHFFISAAEDETGGFILLTSIAGVGVYAKRFTAAGAIINWGASSTLTTDPGITIDAAGTNASAVPVYTNIVENLTSGTTEHGSTGLVNWFYEDDADLLSLVADGDIIYDTANFAGTTIDLSTVVPDFRHIIGQDATQAVSKAAAEAYIVGDAANTDTFTAADHDMNVLPDYANGTNKVYSPHGYTFPGSWTLNVGDLISDGTSFKRINTINTITVAAIDTGTANADLANHLIDADQDFVTASVAANDLVKNTSSSIYIRISNVTANDLTLDADLFPAGTDGYEVYDNTTSPMPSITSGNANIDSFSHLIDTTTDFSGTGFNVQVGDLARNNATGYYARITNVTVTDLTLEADIFPAGSEAYTIFDNTPAMALLASGSASADWTNFLFDATAGWASGAPADDVTVGDLVIKTNAPAATTTVKTVTDDRTLELNADIIATGTENYEIYHNYCITHTSVQTFYEFVLDDNLNATNGAAITLYDYKGVSGTSDIPPANPLFDNDANFIAPTVANGDIALDFTSKAKATVTTATYGVNTRALDLTSNIFTDNENYSIINFFITNTAEANIITLGTADSFMANRLRDSTNAFAGVQPGDVAYNLTDNSYAMVTAVAANDLTLSRNAFDTGNERYVIIRQRGVLYVWQEAGPLVRGSILSVNSGGTPVTLRAEYTIANGSSPTAISDDNGNAIVIYVDTLGEIQATKLDGTGTPVWAAEVDTQTAAAETILKVVSDGAGGAVILYSFGTTMRVQRITSAGARAWNNVAFPGPSGNAVGNPAAAIEPDMVYDGGTDVIVAVNDSGNIWISRVGSTSPWAGYYLTSATGTQQNPKIFLNGANTIIAWEDDRFSTFAGRAIFGMKINAATGTRDVTWYADTTLADLEGVAFVLNDYNEYFGNIRLITYNNGGGGLLFWEDYRTAGEGINLFYEDITVFLP